MSGGKLGARERGRPGGLSRARGGRVRGILVIPAVLAVAGLHAALDEDAGIRRWLYLRAELSDARDRIEDLRSEVTDLHARAERLETDRFAMERAVREELGLARGGQQVVRLRRTDLSSPRIP